MTISLHRPAKGVVGIATGLCLIPLAVTSAEIATHQEASRSVVEITCEILDEGKTKIMRSTGFAWADQQHVVTVLHGVVGCLKRPWVKSEANNSGTAAEVERGLLEADLALLRLDQDIGLTPLQYTASSPVELGPYFIYGYPQFAKLMEGTAAQLKWGVGGALSSPLGNAFSSKDLEALFRDQTYPTRATEIVRLKDPIQSGHSGSPVFDERGRVIAMVDGGLLDGVVGANWVIPTYRYLPALPGSGDQIPGGPSPQTMAVLKSSVTEDETRNVPIEVSSTGSQSVEQTQSDLTLVRRITFGDLEEFISEWDRETYDQSRHNLEGFIGDSEQTNALLFDIYEDFKTGATLAVPSNLPLTWNPDDRAIEAATESGLVRLIISIARKSSFEEAIGAGKREFIDRIAGLATWNEDWSPVTFELQNCVLDDRGACDPDWQWRQNADLYNGIDPVSRAPVEMVLSMAVSDSDVLGTALYVVGDFNQDLTTEDKIDYLMIEAGANLLTDFARH